MAMLSARRCLQTVLRSTVRQQAPSATRIGVAFAGAAGGALLLFPPKRVLAQEVIVVVKDESLTRFVNEILNGKEKISTNDLESTMHKIEKAIYLKAGGRTATDWQMRKVFAKMLARKADSSGDGYVTASDLVDFMRFYDGITESIRDEKIDYAAYLAAAGSARALNKSWLTMALSIPYELEANQRQANAKLMHKQRQEIYMAMFFKVFDQDGNGTLDKSEFENYVELVHGKMSPEKLKSTWRKLDTNDDGKISFDEFRQNYYTCAWGAGQWFLVGLGCVSVCCCLCFCAAANVAIAVNEQENARKRR